MDEYGRSELHYAAVRNDVAAVRSLLAEGADMDASDRQGFTPLHFAAQEGSFEVMVELLKAGAIVDSRNQFGNTPLFTATFNSRGRGDLINLLRQSGADPFSENNAGQTPFGLSQLIGNYDVAQFFADLSDPKK